MKRIFASGRGRISYRNVSLVLIEKYSPRKDITNARVDGLRHHDLKTGESGTIHRLGEVNESFSQADKERHEHEQNLHRRRKCSHRKEIAFLSVIFHEKIVLSSTDDSAATVCTLKTTTDIHFFD